MRARVHELVGQLDLRLVGRRLDDGRLELALDRGLVRLAQPGRDVLAQLGERLKPARLGGEVVVELRQPLRLDLGDLDVELGVLAGELVGIFVGERHLHDAFVAGDAPTSCSSKPGISRCAPSSISWSRPSPPSNGSPSTRPT